VRRLRLGLIVLAVIVFVLISALLARAFSVDGAERAAVTQLVQDEARGDSHAMVKLILGCARSASCRSRATADAIALRRPGRFLLIQINPSAGFSLAATTGTARVAWRAGSSLPIVQCVRVRRAGNVLSGLHVQLLQISRRISSGADCPNRF
jgi:hypothetical protein